MPDIKVELKTHEGAAKLAEWLASVARGKDRINRINYAEDYVILSKKEAKK